MSKQEPKVALIYDRVNTPYGGAEKVLLALHQLYPQAPLFTSVYDKDQAHWAKVFDVKPTFLQKIPGAQRHHRWLAPLMPLAFESLSLDEYDIVISITSAEAKGVLTKPHQLHVCYLLTPTRYLYSHRQEYLESLSHFPGVTLIAKCFLGYLEWWDQAARLRPDVMIPISETVKRRAEKYYNRVLEEVIYPPVGGEIGEVSEIGRTGKQENRKTAPPLTGQGKRENTSAESKPYLVVSRLVPYKRIDLVIEACAQLQRPVVIIGDGPEKPNLVALAKKLNAGALVEFRGHCSQAELSQAYSQAKALLMPGIEDFGITAVEAAAQGVPVILHRDSGAAEILEEGTSSIHVHRLTKADLVEAMHFLDATPFDPTLVKQNTAKYATTVFCQRFKQKSATLWQYHSRQRSLGER